MAKHKKKGRRNRGGKGVLKRCSRCHKNKGLTEYYADRSRGDGLSTKCKKCDYECRKIRRERLQNRTSTQVPNIGLKQCSKCGGTKPVTEFYPALRNRAGYSSWCKLCFHKYGQAYHRRLAAREKSQVPHIETKKCCKCGEVKPVAEFYKAAGKVDGYATVCRDCARFKATEHRNKIAQREFRDIQAIGKKRCWMCKRNLPLSGFNYSRQNLDGLTTYCRECGKEYKRENYEQQYGEYYERTCQYRREYPERYRAYRKVHEAINRGDLVRPEVCSKCGASGTIVGHHDDYDRPLEVVWLCLQCDRQLHADLKRKKRKSG